MVFLLFIIIVIFIGLSDVSRAALVIVREFFLCSSLVGAINM